MLSENDENIVEIKGLRRGIICINIWCFKKMDTSNPPHFIMSQKVIEKLMDIISF